MMSDSDDGSEPEEFARGSDEGYESHMQKLLLIIIDSEITCSDFCPTSCKTGIAYRQNHNRH